MLWRLCETINVLKKHVSLLYSQFTFRDPLHKIFCTALKHSLHILRSHGHFFCLDQHKTFGGCLCKWKKKRKKTL